MRVSGFRNWNREPLHMDIFLIPGQDANFVELIFGQTIDST